MSGVLTAAGIAATASTGSSLLSADKNAKAQAQQLAQEKQLSGEQLDFAKAQYAHERELTDPARQAFLSEAMSSNPYGYEQTKAQIDKNYTNAGLRNNEMNYGLNSDGGLAQARATSLSMGHASDLAGAYQTGLMRRTGMLQAAAGMGNPSGAANGVLGAYGTGIGVAANQANIYGNAAQQGWNNAANGLNGLASYLGSQNTPSSGSTPLLDLYKGGILKTDYAPTNTYGNDYVSPF
jgi:multidrug efflux pump subunit AcrA (membrane-fusion protein)